MRDAVIVSAVRTPLGRRKGQLRDVHPVSLSVLVMKEAIRRAGLRAEQVDQVIWGCANQVGEQASNIARISWLAGGLPVETAGTTVDNRCGSSENSIHLAASLISTGAADIVLAGGVESMTRVPMGSAVGGDLGDPWTAEYRSLYEVVPQGICAQRMAEKYGIDRRSMDEFSVRSHLKAASATEQGRLAGQIVAVARNGEEPVTRDEGIRPNASYESVSAVAPAFEPTHSITAANSSQISDGAAAVLLVAADRLAELGVTGLARVVAHTVVGCDPVLMLEGPIPATAKVLKQAGLGIRDVDLYEVNEAFASVPLAWLKETGADPERLNVNGGAIALGHPLGASGARLMTHLVHELDRRDLRYGLETMCCGGGLGTAVIVERLAGRKQR